MQARRKISGLVEYSPPERRGQSDQTDYSSESRQNCCGNTRFIQLARNSNGTRVGKILGDYENWRLKCARASARKCDGGEVGGESWRIAG